jgi:hypothetical protein
MPNYTLKDKRTGKTYKYAGARTPSQDEASQYIWDQENESYGSKALGALSDVGSSISSGLGKINDTFSSAAESAGKAVGGFGRNHTAAVKRETTPSVMSKSGVIETPQDLWEDRPLLPDVKQPETWTGGFGKGLYNEFVQPLSTPKNLVATALGSVGKRMGSTAAKPVPTTHEPGSFADLEGP